MPGPRAGSPYRSYVYAYPHKTAYRPLEPAVPLAEAWRDERKDALFLYVHVPFCEMRCGFCNLFTTPTPKTDLVAAWTEALLRQARAVRHALGDARFARFAMGGGTPTLLSAAGLATLLDALATLTGVDLARVPASVEVSPETLDREKLTVLRARGVDRISMGVQSFVEAESRAAGRPQSTAEVEAGLDAVRSLGFPTLNVDLIYGLPGQTVESFLRSLRAALSFRPEELYLYPLYVRPLTGLGRASRSWDDERLALYRAGRDFLRDAGYLQSSMRMFRAAHAPSADGPVYCVQDDGMVGLGVGARSYTRALHYGTDYAVGAAAVRDIVAAWVDRAPFTHAERGFVLDLDEQRRRWVELTLLAEGVDRAAYRARFGTDVLADLPELATLVDDGLAQVDDAHLVLTDAGLERSDAIGPWLFSDAVRARMDEWQAR
ncbi:MAG: STM4012 family radical SAM protein [Myxococcales bacterium]|nr:STM4012 family radical SAM protein [Myxococcales bacterium]